MYQAKADGGRSYRFYSADMQTKAASSAASTRELRRAVEHEQFVLHYQPQVDAATGRIVGAEALLRWQREDGTLLSPAAFLSRAEAERPDRPDQRMGAARGLPRGAALAPRRPAAGPHRRQPVAGAVPPAEHRPADHRRAARDRPRAVAAGAGDHREHRDGEHRLAGPRLQPAAQARRQLRHRRFRHRLFVVPLHQVVSDRPAEDRPVLHRATWTRTAATPPSCRRSSVWRRTSGST